MSKTTSDQVVDILAEAGVKRAYGVPGDAIDLILASIHRRKDFDFILARHEEGAGFMATAEAKLTGEMSVVMVCQGPGSAHIVNAMYDGQMDKVPMLVISGQIDSELVGTNSVQELNQILLFEDCTCFNREVRTADNLVDILQLAIQTARARNGVAHVSISTDVLRKAVVPRMPASAVFNMPFKVTPEQSVIEQAAELLNGQKNVTILYGGGSKHCVDEVVQAAGLLNAPIVHTVRSKPLIDNHNPHYAGGIGFKGSHNGCHYVKNCEALLIVGCAFAWREYYPTGVPIVQIDRDPQRIGVRCTVTAGLVGDAKLTMQELIPLLKQKTDDSFLREAQKGHHKAIEKLDKEGSTKDDKHPITSPELTQALSDLMADDAIVTVDAGTVSVWANNWLRLNGKQNLIGSTELGTLGYAGPAAIGCQINAPDKQVIALAGDGGFQMTMGDFSTAMKYNLPIKVILYNNFAYRFIELEQLKEGVEICYTELDNPDYAKLAEAFGGEGYTITKSSELRPTLEKALASDKPCIVDVHVDPKELINPPKYTASMIANFLKGVVKTKMSHSNSEW